MNEKQSALGRLYFCGSQLIFCVIISVELPLHSLLLTASKKSVAGLLLVECILAREKEVEANMD